MSKEVYGLMLIGCGHIGKAHMDDIYYRKGIRLVAVADLQAERAEDFARRYGAEKFGTDYFPFIKDPSVDIVIITTYTEYHLEIILACEQFGKHVICEKPLVSNPEEMQKLHEVIRRDKIKFQPGYILRHNETYKKTAELISEGIIGKPVLMRMIQNHHAMDWPRYKRLMQNASPVLDCSVHYFDVMQWFTGARIVSLTAQGMTLDNDLPPDTMNHGIVQAELSDGSKGFYEAGWSRNIASTNIKEIVGPKGRIRIILQRDRDDHREEGDLIEIYLSKSNEYRNINMNSQYKPMWIQLKSLIMMIENSGSADRIDVETITDAFLAAYYADQAMKTGEKQNCERLRYEK